ncbi:MAG: carbamoyltransferase HypF [Gammaproteobacteria bacterium]|nr:carbamoyltransferase HypF [Gammaproteobacteria bacterium]
MTVTDPDPDVAAEPVAAVYLTVSGRVQGVGFRPFIYRLAHSHHLTGWVRNCTGQVEIHIQGENQALHAFTRRLFQHAPPLSRPVLENCEPATLDDLDDFVIRDSAVSSRVNIHIPPDLFTCDECITEMHNPHNRRYRYPFINCTQCGPRYTLIRGMPYDRPATTMAAFQLCDACHREYTDPLDRRFHAEPVACPACGPALQFATAESARISGNEAALAACVAALQAGSIVAVKGVGGYHLMCDARNDIAIARLRRNKPRAHKPLAVMFPTAAGQPLKCINSRVWLSRDQADLLLSPARPIVLARKRPGFDLSSQIAPGLDEIGVMLPYSPLHHLILSDLGAPLIATSANISGEPVLTDNVDVEQRLGHVAGAFLHHNRPIERPADDPVLRIISDRPRPLRMGRGTAPFEQSLPFKLQHPVLAVGGHMKNTIALAWGKRIVVSPHIGDMGNARSLQVFEKTIDDLQALYKVTAEAVVCDAHPGYASGRWARQTGLPLHKVFHHHAHAAVACDLQQLTQTRLVFTWDGVGYGEDGNLWGGEALLGCPGNWRRFATLRPFHLPGGERAGREPWRSAAAVCWETGTCWPRIPATLALLHKAWQKRINSPQTTSAGRLFDAAAALTGVCTKASFEGQGPMLLEALCHGSKTAVNMPLLQDDSGTWVADWEPLLEVLLDAARSGKERATVFHASMADTILQQARLARSAQDISEIGLSGGVFQNRVLTELAVSLLENDGFHVTLPQHIPVNDAGISYGQLIEYAATSCNPTGQQT